MSLEFPSMCGSSNATGIRQLEAISPQTHEGALLKSTPNLPTGDGKAMMALIEELFPICRSITGNGVRQTLAILQRYIPLEINEVPSGTAVLDWTVPREWNIRDAYIARLDGTRIVDFAANNLHIVQYSRPIDAIMPLSELRPHLHSLPDQPDWIPYRTSYYAENWGFCLTHRQLSSLADGLYRVVIDSDLEPGHLSYGELLIPGETDDTVLFSCHICHPSLANDNLSGIAVATMLARHVQTLRLRYSYRFLFIPGTIGSLTWLARNEDKVGAHCARPCPFLPRRCRRHDLQTEPARERRDRPHRRACPASR